MLDVFSQYELAIEQMRDPTIEPFLTKYQNELVALNSIIMGAGESIEGSLFYRNHLRELPDEPDPVYRYKRRNYLRYVCTGRRILEIGFNGGHSALLALTANKYLEYHAIDICKYKYTSLGFEYLQTLFGNRIDLHRGDSRA